MDGPYLNSLIPIVGGVAASAWAPMSSVTTPTATAPRLYHASALVSSFMVFSWPPHTSERFTSGAVPPGSENVGREQIAMLGVSLMCSMNAAKAVSGLGETDGTNGSLGRCGG